MPCCPSLGFIISQAIREAYNETLNKTRQIYGIKKYTF
jgi:hypothetical protein